MRFGLIATPASQAACCCASSARFEARHMLLGTAREIVVAMPPKEGRGGGVVANVTLAINYGSYPLQDVRFH
jgi:hypothetical protein